jgi:hypothetical protein
MGCCDGHNKSQQGSSSVPNTNDDDDDGTLEEGDTFNPQVEQQEAWATAEGYTPLADLNSMYKGGAATI